MTLIEQIDVSTQHLPDKSFEAALAQGHKIAARNSAGRYEIAELRLASSNYVLPTSDKIPGYYIYYFNVYAR